MPSEGLKGSKVPGWKSLARGAAIEPLSGLAPASFGAAGNDDNEFVVMAAGSRSLPTLGRQRRRRRRFGIRSATGYIGRHEQRRQLSKSIIQFCAANCPRRKLISGHFRFSPVPPPGEEEPRERAALAEWPGKREPAAQPARARGTERQREKGARDWRQRIEEREGRSFDGWGLWFWMSDELASG